ncbi:MAG: multiple resistance and pH regulation protein F [Ectothiorhodospiraceae bacterium]|nr:multiple resistance and pH regulation protein F [Ectothiorhodospiraceae bacterium]MCH8504736.1 multiple resistance and pH regulation protein F [Ectothiorhodospiraceae bacterium]
MNALLGAAALFLLVQLALGLWRVYLGPGEADRMLAVQLLGTTTVGLLIVLGALLQQRALMVVALLFALLAFLVAVAFVRRGNGEGDA